MMTRTSSDPETARVLVLSSVHPARDPRIFDKQIRSLLDAGHAVTWCRPGPVNAATAYPGLEEISFPARRGRVQRIATSWVAARRIIREQQPAVVHLHDPELLLVALLPRHPGVRYIYDAHEDIGLQVLAKPWLPVILRRPVAFLSNAVARLLMRRFDAVVAATTDIRERLASLPVAKAVLRNFPRLEQFPLAATAPEDFVYVGRISLDRGLEEMLSLARSTGRRLSLAGRVDAGCEPMLEAAVRDGVCRHAGELDRAGVASLLQQGGIGLCLLHDKANYRTALPTKLFEYMAAGLPVLATAFPLWRDIVRSANAGLTIELSRERQDWDDVQRWLDSGTLSEQGKSGRQYVEAHANWGREAASLLALYRELGAGAR